MTLRPTTRFASEYAKLTGLPRLLRLLGI